ncbi:MAG TPA: hypothetical protein ACFCUY_14180 [Xenococcaceae cyanobacterium]
MTTQEEARKAMAQSRQQEEHLDENMLSRSQEKIAQDSSPEIGEEARELIVGQRQHDQNTRDTMLSRSEAEIDT